MLIHEGKPLGQLTLLAFPSPNHGALPFGALTLTNKNRIVFWPVGPRNMKMVAQTDQIGVIDHLTLELPSEKIHATAYDAGTQPLHYAASDLGHTQSWRLQHFEGTGLALWFTLLVRWSVLLDQDFAVQRRVCAPTADADRRKMEFASFASQIKVIDVPLPPGPSAGNYVYCVAYFVTDTSAEIQLSSDVFPLGHLNGQVDGYSATPNLDVRALRLPYAVTQFVFAAACPPGELTQGVVVGFPRQRLDSATTEQ
jgi:hypothetical protein